MPTSTPGMITLFMAYWLAIQHTARGAVPNDTSLKLTRVMGTPNISIGEKNQLTIEIDFPVGTINNVVIEIISSIEATVLAFVKVVNSSVGSNIMLDQGKAAILNNPDVYPGIEYVSAVKVRYNTRAVIDLGTISNAGSNTNLSASQISITYEIVMVSDAGLGTGAEHWTSVGIEYNRSQYVWINQISYALNNTIKGVPGDPDIQCNILDAPNNLKLGEKSTFHFNMKIPNPKFTLLVEAEWLNATHPENFVLTMKVTDAGESFKYFLILSDIAAENFLCPLTPFLGLEIPNLVNKESTVSGSDEASDTISVEVTIQNTFDLALQGTQLFFGLRVEIDSKEIWVSHFAIVVDPPSWNPLSGAIVAEVLGNDSVSPGFPAVVMASIKIPPETGHVYEITVSTSTTSGKDPALSVLALSPIVNASNLPCSYSDFKTVNSSVYRSEPPTVTSKTFTFTLSNIGYFNDSTANTLNFTIVSLLMDRIDVVQNDTHLLTITAKSSGGTSLAVVTVTFTVGIKEAYPNSVRHEFQILSECEDNNYLQDTMMSVKIRVDIEEGVVSGPMVFQLLMPQNDTTSIVYFRKAEVVEVGKNVICVSPGDSFELNVTTWEESIDWKRGIVTFPVICNFNLSSDPLANRFVLKVDLEIFGTGWDRNGSQSGYVVYSAKFSETQTWVGRLAIEVHHQPSALNETAIITGILVNYSALINVTWPDRYVVQYSVDGITFTDAPNRTDFWMTKSMYDKRYIEYFMSVPIISKYVRLSTAPNKSGCWIDNYFVTTPAASVLKIWGDVNDTLLFKMNKVFDRNPATCFVPPINGVDTHPPMLWLRMNLSFFNLKLGAPYKVKVTGENLLCDRHSSPKSMHVAYPHETKSSHDFEGYIRFCTLSGNDSTQCTFNCPCTNSVSCKETFLYMRSDGDTINPARLCELQVTLA